MGHYWARVITDLVDVGGAEVCDPVNPLQRMRHRSWVEFGSALLNLIRAFYSATDDLALIAWAAEFRGRITQIELAFGEEPYFAGESFSMVDAVFGPVFRYFDVFDAIGEFGFWEGSQKVHS